MTISNLEDFMIKFFTENNCKIIEQSNGVLRVKLTEDLDKELMNRPFYWHYMKSMGNQGEPMTLELTTNPNKQTKSSEWIHFGSPRLHQIWNYLAKKEKYTLLFQEVNATQNTAMHPWLLINMKVSYKGKQIKEEIISLGIQLLNGKIIVNMMEELEHMNLKQTISDFCYTISPIITIQSGYKRLEKVVEDYILSQPMEWVDETKENLNEELELLNHFYKDNQEDALYKQEMNEMKNRYNPMVEMKVINGGILYLQDSIL